MGDMMMKKKIISEIIEEVKKVLQQLEELDRQVNEFLYKPPLEVYLNMILEETESLRQRVEELLQKVEPPRPAF
jgi:cell division septum initiation protein DivIVA